VTEYLFLRTIDVTEALIIEVLGYTPADDADLTAHIVDTVAAHAASAISNTPAGTISATTVQAAITELDGDITAHLADLVDAHDASAISFSPTGGIAATDVQAAIAEVDSEKLSITSTAYRQRQVSLTPFYVRVDGNNSNNGQADTAGGAWLTPAGAFSWLATYFDVGNIKPTVNIQPGTYAPFTVAHPWVGTSYVNFQGFPTISATGMANNGSGLIRVSGDFTAAIAAGLATGFKVCIRETVGTTEANNTDANPVWTITVISNSAIDLQGSTFTNAWVSNGKIVTTIIAATGASQTCVFATDNNIIDLRNVYLYNGGFAGCIGIKISQGGIIDPREITYGPLSIQRQATDNGGGINEAAKNYTIGSFSQGVQAFKNSRVNLFSTHYIAGGLAMDYYLNIQKGAVVSTGGVAITFDGAGAGTGITGQRFLISDAYKEDAGTTWPGTVAGTDDAVRGPSAAVTNNTIVGWDGVTGNLVKQLSAANAKSYLAIVAADVSDFTEAVEDAVGAILVATEATGDLDWTYTDGSSALSAIVKAARFSTPGAIGNTSPSTGAFTNLNLGQLAGYRNFLHNGAMAVAGRGAGPFESTSVFPNNDAAILLDRWRIISDGNDVVDVSQNTATVPTGGKYSLALDVETVNLKFGIVQVIESRDCPALLSGTQQVTFSFKAKVSSTTKLDNVKAAIVSWSSTADGTQTDPISAWNVEGTNPTLKSNYTYENTPANLNLTTSFATYSVTATIDTASTKNIMVMIWSDVTDTTLGDFLYITECQLEPGVSATPFEHRPYAHESVLCQRFLPAWPAGNMNGWSGGGQATSSSSAGHYFMFYCPPRIVPTGATVSAATDFSVLDATSTLRAYTGLSFNTATGLLVQLNGSGASSLTAGHHAAIYGENANAFLVATGAEL